MTVLEILIIVVVIFDLGAIINRMLDIKKYNILYNNNNKTNSIPFKESMDLIHLPIVTFTNNNTKLHFLLDTGSDDSYISSKILPSLNIKNTKIINKNIVTSDNEVSSTEIITIDLSYKSEIFETPMLVTDLTRILGGDTIRGIPVHGILGSIFFERHKYHINYENYEAYSNSR